MGGAVGREGMVGYVIEEILVRSTGTEIIIFFRKKNIYLKSHTNDKRFLHE